MDLVYKLLEEDNVVNSDENTNAKALAVALQKYTEYGSEIVNNIQQTQDIKEALGLDPKQIRNSFVSLVVSQISEEEKNSTIYRALRRYAVGDAKIHEKVLVKLINLFSCKALYVVTPTIENELKKKPNGIYTVEYDGQRVIYKNERGDILNIESALNVKLIKSLGQIKVLVQRGNVVSVGTECKGMFRSLAKFIDGFNKTVLGKHKGKVGFALFIAGAITAFALSRAAGIKFNPLNTEFWKTVFEYIKKLPVALRLAAYLGLAMGAIGMALLGLKVALWIKNKVLNILNKGKNI